MGDNEKANYLEVHFESKPPPIESKSPPLKSPVLIPAKLISKLRKEVYQLGLGCFAKFDPDLYSKNNLINTFKYIFENVNHKYTGQLRKYNFTFKNHDHGAYWYHYQSKLPPSTTNYVYIEPKYAHYFAPDFGQLEDQESTKIIFKQGRLIFNIHEIGFGLLFKNNEVNCLGFSVNNKSIDGYASVFHDQQSETITREISELNLDFDQWRYKMEEKNLLCSDFTKEEEEVLYSDFTKKNMEEEVGEEKVLFCDFTKVGEEEVLCSDFTKKTKLENQ